jgi:hypothetical protein
MSTIVDEYVCITVNSGTGEPQADFNSRLITFWSYLLRTRPDDYEQVYAETTKFVQAGNRITRQYLVAEKACDLLVEQLNTAGLETGPIDPTDIFSKYEATSPDWFQLEH